MMWDILGVVPVAEAMASASSTRTGCSPECQRTWILFSRHHIPWPAWSPWRDYSSQAILSSITTCICKCILDCPT